MVGTKVELVGDATAETEVEIRPPLGTGMEPEPFGSRDTVGKVVK